MFHDILLRSKISPSAFQYVEAHGTGTQVGDPIEIKAIAEVFCKGREEPFYVGSVKSNLGHSEAAAGIYFFLLIYLLLCRERNFLLLT